MLIIGCLLPMIVLTFLSIIFENEYPSVNITIKEGEVETVENFTESYDWAKPFTDETIFNIDPVIGAITIISVIIVIATILGIRILGSGLSETSLKILTTGVAYLGLWFILTILVSELIFSIKIFGSIIYIALSLGYTIGVIDKINKSD